MTEKALLRLGFLLSVVPCSRPILKKILLENPERYGVVRTGLRNEPRIELGKLERLVEDVTKLQQGGTR